jgi:hypothetical protein
VEGGKVEIWLLEWENKWRAKQKEVISKASVTNN